MHDGERLCRTGGQEGNLQSEKTPYGFSILKLLRELVFVLKVYGEGASQLQNLHRHSKPAREAEQDFSNRFPLLKG